MFGIDVMFVIFGSIPRFWNAMMEALQSAAVRSCDLYFFVVYRL